jgi:hypothetical protein
MRHARKRTVEDTLSHIGTLVATIQRMNATTAWQNAGYVKP